ncbi:MAG: F0F1 ATP synthase subunit epsilon [Bacillota bacterium]
MAEKTVLLEVVTAERIVFQKEVESLVVPATEGYLGILPGHAPLITGLSVGVARYRANGQSEKMAISGGFLEVSNNKTVLLADTAELPSEIDINRAERAKERAEKRLNEKGTGTDVYRAELALKRAMARIRAVR